MGYEEVHVGSGFSVQMLERLACQGVGCLPGERWLEQTAVSTASPNTVPDGQGILLDPSARHCGIRLGTAACCYFSPGEGMLSLVQTRHVSSKSPTGFGRFSFKICIRSEDFSEKQHG